MAPTTYRAFVDALEAMTVTGVSKNYTQGPPIGATGGCDCPAKFVRYPGGDERPIVFGSHGGWPAFTIEVVVVVKAVGQDTAFANFDAAVDMMDNLSAALRDLSCIVKSKMGWGIRQSIETVAGQEYWAVVASITQASG